MLKHCVETMFGNKGEGLLQACISSFILDRIRPELERKTVVEDPISPECLWQSAYIV